MITSASDTRIILGSGRRSGVDSGFLLSIFTPLKAKRLVTFLGILLCLSVKALYCIGEAAE